ncbi:S8 family peptidase [Sphingomonas sp. PB2P19]|uniref:S8 family peptidase n=1 Tax=Sphingomonas rhamnosi TaxID=3096156 RepID=UPI002FC6ABB1
MGPAIDKGFSDILDRDDIEVADDPSALAPERALVIEIIGSPERFVNAASKVGLEWLAEEVATLRGVRSYFDPATGVSDDDDEQDEEGGLDADVELLANEDVTSDEVSGALYLGMPTKATFELLRSLWNKFKADEPAPDKHGDWWKLFGLLHQLRPWGPEDRIGEATRRRLREEQSRTPGDDLRLEVDLWYRGDGATRLRAVTEFRANVELLGGTVLDEERIDEIRYHSALIHLPGDAVDEIIARTGTLALDDDIMSIRPQNGFRFAIDELIATEAEDDEESSADPVRASIAALLDGWPVENHALLRNRLDVIELEVADSMAPVNRRFHGTAMASLILRGDLSEANPPIDRRLKVVPVLMPDGSFETPPKDKLALGVIHRAVKELKEGTGGLEASGPDVVVINHSICDEAFGFAGTMSAWARLLDHLAWKYKVLFVISAGNIRDTFEVPGYKTGAAMRAATAEHRRAELLRAVEASKSQRTIFAPAESVNALTVAAAHADGSTLSLPANLSDPFGDVAAPILASGLGHGFNRSVKPDVMLPGGRQVAHPTEGAMLRVHGREHPDRFGQSVASPDPHGGHLDFTRRSAGTSNAAALATRMAMLIGDVLDDSPINTEQPWYTRPTAPCVLKALIAHGASWGDLGQEMTGVHIPSGHVVRRKEAVSRAIGYGAVDSDRVVGGGGHRVTLLAEDSIRKEQRHEWRIPLPTELRSSVEFRRIVVTLAWLTPVFPNSSQYRAVALDLVGTSGKTQLWEGVQRVSNQPAVGFARRGTLIHAVYEGNRKAIPFGDDGDFVINVQSVSKMPHMSRVDVPYAMAVTIEVADSINADIAASIRSRVMPQTRTRN